MTPPKSIANAKAMLEYMVKVAGQLITDAKHYLAEFESRAAMEVVVGNFYKTFDGSVVYALKNVNKCQCPVCAGRTTGQSSVMSLILGQGEATPAVEHNEEANKQDPQYVIVVLRGGHGLKDVRGEEPGDQYTVDKDGFALMWEQNTGDNKDIVSNIGIMVAGLSLKTLLRVRVEENANVEENR